MKRGVPLAAWEQATCVKPRVRMQDESVESGNRYGVPPRRLVEEA